jgi:hypothetical protein
MLRYTYIACLFTMWLTITPALQVNETLFCPSNFDLARHKKSVQIYFDLKTQWNVLLCQELNLSHSTSVGKSLPVVRRSNLFLSMCFHEEYCTPTYIGNPLTYTAMRVSDVKLSDPRLIAGRYKYIIASISDPCTK